MERKQLDWNWFDEAARSLARRCLREALDEGGQLPDGIVALGRGGMPLATRLSHLMDVQVVGVVLVSRFAGPGVAGPELSPVEGVVLAPHVLRRRGRLLLVDCMISGGISARLGRESLVVAGVAPERLVVCALLARARHAAGHLVNSIVPDDDTWYVFPWETR